MLGRLQKENSYDKKTNNEEATVQPDNVIQLPIKNINNKTEKNNKVVSDLLSKIKINPNYTAYYIIAFLLVVFVIWGLTHKNAQQIFVNDVKIGAIQDMDITSEQLFNTAIAKLRSDVGVNIEVNEIITLKPIHAGKKDVVNTDYALTEICRNFTYQVEASTILIDGTEYAIAKNEETAKAILNSILEKYSAKEGSEIIERTFVEDVQIVPKYVSNDEIELEENILSILTSNSSEQRSYTVKSGDTLWSIANNADMTLDELIAANSGITENSVIKLGQVLNLVVPVPLLSVKTTEKIIYNETIPKSVETVNNDSEYKTYRKVLQSGSNGQKEVTANVVYINGIETSREVVGESVTINPVTERIEVGTLQTPPKRALGSFIYPVSGRLSSSFGARWGTRHEGIDLACAYGTSIHASDGGKVVYSGWNSGGYGYLVIIDHGNGFQTYYGHNSQNVVSVGDMVAQGEVIAKVGSTGNSTGNHVHFEIRKNGVPTNPFDYL